MNRKLLSVLPVMLISLKSIAAMVLQLNDEEGKIDLKIKLGEIKKENTKKSEDRYKELLKKGKIKKNKVSNDSSETGSKTITGTGG